VRSCSRTPLHDHLEGITIPRAKFCADPLETVAVSVDRLYICLCLLFQLLEKAAKNFAFQETIIENSTTVSNLKFLAVEE